MGKGAWLGWLCLGCAAWAPQAAAHVSYYAAHLRGPNVVPASGSAASGFAFLVYNHHFGELDMSLVVHGIGLEDLSTAGPNGHSSFLGIGEVGVEEGYAVDLQWGGATFYESNETLRLDISNLFIGGEQGDLDSFWGDNQHALAEGRMYIELLTNTFPLGEIRGQFFRTLHRLPEASGGLFIPAPALIPAPGPAPSVATSLPLLGLVAAAARRRRGR